MKASDHADELMKEAREKVQEAERLQQLQKEFPDLRRHVGRWNKVAWCSKSVNARVDRFDMRHNCGCCRDSPLEVWPYLETPHGKVYADPPQYFVGHDSPYGDLPEAGWEAKMLKEGIPESVVGAVSVHFRRAKDEAFDDVRRAFGDDDG